MSQEINFLADGAALKTSSLLNLNTRSLFFNNALALTLDLQTSYPVRGWKRISAKLVKSVLNNLIYIYKSLAP